METKIDFYNKIEESYRHYRENSPCRNCTPSDYCRICEKGRDNKKYIEVVQCLIDEYNTKFNSDYYKDVEEIERQHYINVRKKTTLENVWETCNIDEILQYGIDNGKCGKFVSIDKVCEWFKQVLFIHTSECDEYHNPIVSTDCETINEFINDFHKAMEE